VAFENDRPYIIFMPRGVQLPSIFIDPQATLIKEPTEIGAFFRLEADPPLDTEIVQDFTAGQVDIWVLMSILP
jgi:hypothetical protein